MDTVLTERPFLVVGKPDIGEAEEAAVLDVLRSGWLGNGKVAQQFEEEFSAHLRVQESVAVNSCTMGLTLCLMAEGIGHGDEVITTPMTFSATLNAILMTGAKPVFVDVDYMGCIDVEKIGAAITTKTKAIIPIHLAGSPCNMAMINAIAKRHKLIVIEDAAHAFGGHFLGIPCGTLGDYGVFSLYPTKNITSGEGGMVVGKSKEKLARVRLLASQGITASAWERYGTDGPRDYEAQIPGFKGLQPDVLAAIGLTQLRRWEELKEKRESVWKVYEQAFGVRVDGHSHHLYTIMVTERARIRKFLHLDGIGTGVHYNSLHLEPAYKNLVKRGQSFPVSEKIGKMTLSLPLSSTMTPNDAKKVVFSVREAIKEVER